MKRFEIGKALYWDPFDDSEESQRLGDILFGKNQDEIRSEMRKHKDAGGTLRVMKVDRDSGTITFQVERTR